WIGLCRVVRLPERMPENWAATIKLGQNGCNACSVSNRVSSSLGLSTAFSQPRNCRLSFLGQPGFYATIRQCLQHLECFLPPDFFQDFDGAQCLESLVRRWAGVQFRQERFSAAAYFR